MSDYILQYHTEDGRWEEAASSWRIANKTLAEAWALADDRAAQLEMPYRVVVEKVVSTPVFVEVPRPPKAAWPPKPAWKVGKVYQHKVTGYVTDFHVEAVSDDGQEAQGWFLHRVDGSLRVETRDDRANFTEV